MSLIIIDNDDIFSDTVGSKIINKINHMNPNVNPPQTSCKSCTPIITLEAAMMYIKTVKIQKMILLFFTWA